jgi:hypothetical protein
VKANFEKNQFYFEKPFIYVEKPVSHLMGSRVETRSRCFQALWVNWVRERGEPPPRLVLGERLLHVGVLAAELDERLARV